LKWYNCLTLTIGKLLASCIYLRTVLHHCSNNLAYLFCVLINFRIFYTIFVGSWLGLAFCLLQVWQKAMQERECETILWSPLDLVKQLHEVYDIFTSCGVRNIHCNPPNLTKGSGFNRKWFISDLAHPKQQAAGATR